jgi:hypothetical protein
MMSASFIPKVNHVYAFLLISTCALPYIRTMYATDWCMFRDVCADGPLAVSVLYYDTSYATPHHMRLLKFAVVMELRYHPM